MAKVMLCDLCKKPQVDKMPAKISIKGAKGFLTKGDICGLCALDLSKKINSSDKLAVVDPIDRIFDPLHRSPLIVLNDDTKQEEQMGVQFDRNAVFDAMDRAKKMYNKCAHSERIGPKCKNCGQLDRNIKKGEGDD